MRGSDERSGSLFSYVDLEARVRADQAPRRYPMKGKWRIVEMPDFDKDYLDMMQPAYILFDGEGGGEFIFGCVTGALCGGGSANTVHFPWDGNDEMDEAGGHGWAKLQPDGSLGGQINFDNGDDFIAKPWGTSSTAC